MMCCCFFYTLQTTLMLSKRNSILTSRAHFSRRTLSFRDTHNQGRSSWMNYAEHYLFAIFSQHFCTFCQSFRDGRALWSEISVGNCQGLYSSGFFRSALRSALRNFGVHSAPRSGHKYFPECAPLHSKNYWSEFRSMPDFLVVGSLEKI